MASFGKESPCLRPHRTFASLFTPLGPGEPFGKARDTTARRFEVEDLAGLLKCFVRALTRQGQGWVMLREPGEIDLGVAALVDLYNRYRQ